MNERQCFAKSSSTSRRAEDPTAVARFSELAGDDTIAHFAQAGIQRNRLRLFAAKLQAVVLRRVVRRRNHHAAVEAVFADREIERVGRDQADVDDIGAGFHCALGKGRRKRDAGGPHVAPDRDAFSSKHFDEGAPYVADDRFVDLCRIDAAHVVALEDRRIEVDGHRGPLRRSREKAFRNEAVGGRRGSARIADVLNCGRSGPILQRVDRGERIVPKSKTIDPNVFVWDRKDLMVAYASGIWPGPKTVLQHAFLSKAPERSELGIACDASAVRPKNAIATQDAVAIRIIEGPHRGRSGWVASDEVHLLRPAGSARARGT